MSNYLTYNFLFGYTAQWKQKYLTSLAILKFSSFKKSIKAFQKINCFLENIELLNKSRWHFKLFASLL